MKQISLFEDQRLDRAGAVELSLASLREYGQRYRHWAIAYSGGKDSSATVTFVAWAIKTGQLEPPETLTVLYADTRQELPPLQQAAMHLLDDLARDGFNTRAEGRMVGGFRQQPCRANRAIRRLRRPTGTPAHAQAARLGSFVEPAQRCTFDVFRRDYE
jgi:3'-phosphoadenosine 5'-phosphosulfate sulfotransferase (PAPS reductase)/FAD synthetase